MEKGHISIFGNKDQSPPRRDGTSESCSYCGKGFGPAHVVSKKNVHYVFRVRTKFATFYGQTHMNCVEKLYSLQLPGTE